MITFAIPYYDQPDYLARAVQSALTQAEAEVLVVDDCSPEPPPRFDARVRYFRNATRLGMAENWNRCLALARTRYVTLLHADDELMPAYSRTVLPLFAHGVSAAFCGAEIIDARGAPALSVPDLYKRFITPRTEPILLEGEQGMAALLRGNFIMCPTLCYDREALGAHRFDPRDRFVLDLAFVTGLLACGHRIAGTHARAYRYRRHGQNATVHLSASLVAFEEERAIWQRLTALCAARGWHRAAAIGARRAVLKKRLAFAALGDIAHGDLRSAWRKLRLMR